MTVSQLRRLLRTLPESSTVLLAGVAGKYTCFPSDVRFEGPYGTRRAGALVIGPFTPTPPRRLPRGQHKLPLRPIERIRARQSASK